MSNDKNIRDAEEEVSRAQAALAFTREVKALLPEGVSPHRILDQRVYARGGLKFEVERFADALPLLAKLPPVPMVLARGTFTVFGAQSVLTTAPKLEGYTFEEIGPFTLEVSHGAGFHTETLEWVTQLGPHLIEVECELVRLATPRFPVRARKDERKFAPDREPKHAKRINYWGEPPKWGGYMGQELVNGSAHYRWYFSPGQDPAEILGEL